MATVAGTLAVIGWLRPRQAVEPADLALTIALPDESGIEPLGSTVGTPNISPDGLFVAYHDRTRTLKLRRLNSESPDPFKESAGSIAR